MNEIRPHGDRTQQRTDGRVVLPGEPELIPAFGDLNVPAEDAARCSHEEGQYGTAGEDIASAFLSLKEDGMRRIYDSKADLLLQNRIFRGRNARVQAICLLQRTL
jgi:hypothetical protein